MYNEHRNHIDKTIRNVLKTINNSQNKMDNVAEASMYQMPHYQWKKRSEATQTLHGGCSKADPQTNTQTDRGDYNTLHSLARGVKIDCFWCSDLLNEDKC